VKQYPGRSLFPLIGGGRYGILDRIGQQPKGWLVAEGLGLLCLVAVVDMATTWRFSMFGLYCTIVFVMALHLPSRKGGIFALLALILTMMGELDSIEVRGWDGYMWSSMNRVCGMLFAAGSGLSLRKLREEMQQRFEALEHARELERDWVRAAEQEQMRLGQDLHDGVCQTLAALDCAAECLRLDLEADESARVGIATEIKKGLSEATLELRNLARGIYPIWKEDETLVTALSTLVARLNTMCRGRIRFQSNRDYFPHLPETAMHLYRIAQEALQNAMRHANATQIIVEVQANDDGLILTVEDDGCGSGTQKRPDGIGWRTMQYRAHIIGADISISSRSTGGTLVRCTLPSSSPARK